jgi:hypothetical protein
MDGFSQPFAWCSPPWPWPPLSPSCSPGWPLGGGSNGVEVEAIAGTAKKRGTPAAKLMVAAYASFLPIS